MFYDSGAICVPYRPNSARGSQNSMWLSISHFLSEYKLFLFLSFLCKIFALWECYCRKNIFIYFVRDYVLTRTCEICFFIAVEKNTNMKLEELYYRRPKIWSKWYQEGGDLYSLCKQIRLQCRKALWKMIFEMTVDDSLKASECLHWIYIF